jgi:glycoside/pentoside/hexuronide:cation symporter, GPH family
VTSTSDTSSDAPLTIRHKASYAVGDIADGIQGALVNTFLLFYLTTICGMPGSLAGLALAITLVIEAGTTPLFGYLSDHTRSRWGRRHPYMLFACVPLALSIGLVFSIPRFESSWAMFAYVLAVLIVLRGSFSAFALPYAALGAELSKEYEERAVIMAYRNFFNIGGTLLCYVLGFGVFLAGADDQLVSRAAYIAFGWVCAAIVLAAALTAFAGSLDLRHRLQHSGEAAAQSFARVVHELKDVFRNPSFTVLFVMVLIMSVAQGTSESLSVHAFRYFWEASSETTNRIFIVRVVGMACGIPLYTALLKRMEKRDILIVAIVVGSGAQFALPLLAIGGLLPTQSEALNAILYVASFINGGLITFLFISFGSMAADAADEHDLRFGVRREGLYFAGLIFFGKCALGVGTLLAGVALDVIDFPADLATNPAQVIAPEAITRLGLVYGPIAASLGLIAAAALVPYRLDRRAHARIREALAARAIR